MGRHRFSAAPMEAVAIFLLLGQCCFATNAGNALRSRPRLLLHATRALAKPRSSLTHIVFTFHAQQLDSALENLRTWDRLYPPCPLAQCSRIRATVGVLFHVGFSAKAEIVGIQRKLTEAWQTMPSRCCFTNMEVEFVQLDARDDSHITGARVMFEHLICGRTNRAMQTVLYMEPDLRPIQPNWLLKCQLETPTSSVHWIKGSAFRGDVSKLYGHPITGSYLPDFYHINGNAFYSVGKPLCDFYKDVRKFVVEKHGDSISAYDTDIAEYLMNVHTWEKARHYFHRLAFTDVIQNMWQTSYNVEEMVALHPNTYLVHGGKQL